MPLYLAAGRLWNALGRYDLRDLEAGVFVDEPADRCGGIQEVRHAATVQHEHDQFFALRAGLCDAGGDHFVQFKAGRTMRDVFQIVRVVVLAVDENDFLGAARDVKACLVNCAKIAGVDPAARVYRGRSGLRVGEVAARDTGAANQDVSNGVVRQPDARVICNEQFRVRHHVSHAHELEHITRRRGIELEPRADVQAMPIRAYPPIVQPQGRQGDGERGLRQSVYRVHGLALEAGVGKRAHEFIAQGHRYRFRPVVNRANCRQVEVFQPPITQYLEKMTVAEVRG